jgi:phosphopantetheinyl transferase (holo-ACP synthase)
MEPAISTFPYHLVEVRRDEYGRPSIKLSGLVEKRFEDDGGGNVLVSLSHDGPVATAIVFIHRTDGPTAA